MAGGALIGPLVEAGVSRDDAERYERDFEEGRAIIGVTALYRRAEAEEILRRHGASLAWQSAPRRRPSVIRCLRCPTCPPSKRQRS